MSTLISGTTTSEQAMNVITNYQRQTLGYINEGQMIKAQRVCISMVDLNLVKFGDVEKALILDVNKTAMQNILDKLKQAKADETVIEFVTIAETILALRRNCIKYKQAFELQLEPARAISKYFEVSEKLNEENQKFTKSKRSLISG